MTTKPCVVCMTPTTLQCECRKVNYCSSKCQKIDWDRHWPHCDYVHNHLIKQRIDLMSANVGACSSGNVGIGTYDHPKNASDVPPPLEQIQVGDRKNPPPLEEIPTNHKNSMPPLEMISYDNDYDDDNNSDDVGALKEEEINKKPLPAEEKKCILDAIVKKATELDSKYPLVLDTVETDWNKTNIFLANHGSGKVESLKRWFTGWVETRPYALVLVPKENVIQQIASEGSASTLLPGAIKELAKPGALLKYLKKAKEIGDKNVHMKKYLDAYDEK